MLLVLELGEAARSSEPELMLPLEEEAAPAAT